MKIEKVEIRKAKNAKKDFLQNGVADLTLKEFGIDIKNIPYRVTTEKEISVTSPGVTFSHQKAKGEPVENKLIPTVSFHDSAIWDAIVEAIKKEILATL
jgi:hypothetical protein